jgi:hypothetical protein
VKRLVCFSVIAILMLTESPYGYAQETKRDLDYLERQTREERKTSRMAQKAEQKEAFEEVGKLTYEEILKQPDNIELNYQFALQQITRGDLMGASSTLERILILNPDLYQVRLLYGVILYRLDNLTEAKSALESLKNVEIPQAVREEVNRYLEIIKRRKRRTHLGLRHSVGYGYDTNRNAAPASKMRLFMDNALSLTGSDLRRGDVHMLNMTTVDVSQDLGFQQGHQLLGSFTYFRQDQQHVRSMDLESFDYYAGAKFKSRWVNFTPVFRATHVFLSSENFLRSQGGYFVFDRNFGKLDLNLNTRIERQDFMNISENTTNHDRMGVRFDLQGGAGYQLIPSMRFSYNMGYGHKSAKREYYAYDALYMTGGNTWLLGYGQFLSNSLTYEKDVYSKPDTFVAGRHRKDNLLTYQMTYGAPLTFFLIGKVLPKPMQDITASFTYQCYRSLSNITNYTYTDNMFQGMLTKKFDF